MADQVDTASAWSPRRIARNAAAMLAVGVVAAVVWGGALAFLSWRATDTSLPLPERYAASNQALKLAPWFPAVRARQGYLAAQTLFAQGKTLAAVDVMGAAYGDAVGDPQMLAYYRKLQDALALETNRKAHLQHGHEGPGGTLKPSDIER